MPNSRSSLGLADGNCRFPSAFDPVGLGGILPPSLTSNPQEVRQWSASDIVRMRGELEFTQQMLAEKLGLSQRAIQDLESGRSRVRQVHELALSAIRIRHAIEKNDWKLLGSQNVDLVNLAMAKFSDQLWPLHKDWRQDEEKPRKIAA